MKQAIIVIIILLVGLGAGFTAGIMITNSKNKVVIADLQAKMQQSEALSQERIRSYDSTVNRLGNELQRAKIEIEQLNTPAPAVEEVVVTTAENETTAAASADNSIPQDTKLYTIKSGDSLWTIAQKQLGNSTRFKEILKLNPKISEESNLVIGTTLKIPSK